MSPHVYLLAILFRHKAWKSDDLNNDYDLIDTIDVWPGENETRLALREDIQDDFIFRRSAPTISGRRISNEPITLGMMADWVSKVGMLAGFEHSTFAYTLRYMAGNSLDQSRTYSPPLAHRSVSRSSPMHSGHQRVPAKPHAGPYVRLGHLPG